MFSFQTNSNRLSSLTGDIIEEKNKKFSGIVKVSIDDLVFSPEFMPCDQNITTAKVSRLKRIFKTEGCNRRDPSNFILGTISASLLTEALLLSKLTLDELRSSEGSRMLYLPRFQYIKCANGRSRAAALLDTPHLGTWWTVELYVAPALLDLILNIPGMREGFEIGTWHKIISGKCDEEVVRYMEFTLESWVKLMGSKEALINVDTEDVKEFQLRVPGVSQVDYRYLADLIEGGPDDVFFERLKSLYLYIMQDLVELTGEWPLLEDGEEPPETPFRHPTNWHQLAQNARRLGFESDEIMRLAVTNPDEQVASKALQDARPTAFYEYDESEMQNILSRIVHAFERARARDFTDIESTFTTIGSGEPIARRCGRQYSGAYMRDRWSFDLSAFSRRTSESRDITSLFVRKSVFHAFWRLNEDRDGDEPMLHPEGSSPGPQTSESDQPLEAPATSESTESARRDNDNQREVEVCAKSKGDKKKLEQE
ncbi:intracellular transport uso1 [Fusarium mundagurra]|uniref:Intracellular transport uso1 n=1 Tax=Fusarium mundagurra TaxID=1567541 RepID=A0A8H5Z5S8_9HYPO|nr:intracellular transport uso1 [Fusarium mundagurra]